MVSASWAFISADLVPVLHSHCVIDEGSIALPLEQVEHTDQDFVKHHVQPTRRSLFCSLSHGILCILPEVGRPKAQNNTVSWNAGLDQFFSDAVFGTIPLDPHFPVDNVDVDNASMDA